MRRTLLFLALSFTACWAGAQAVEPCFIEVSDGGTTSTAMSPSGKYAVGQSTGVGDAPTFTSYLWDTEAGKLTWMAELDETDYDKSGYFADVNDEKTIVGYFKDKKYTLTYQDMGDVFSAPICVAAVWKDGKTTSLGIGDFTLNDFTGFSDGSFASAVSADSKTVVGYINQGNSTTFTPCGWTYNEATQAWDFKRYAVPAGSQGGQIGSISADGKVAVGYIAYQLRGMPAIWTSPDECTLIELTAEDVKYKEEFNFNYGYKISPNGQYVLFTLNNMTPCVYSVKDKKYVKIPPYADATGLSVRAISDQGDVVGAFRYGNFFAGTYTRPFWYSYRDNKCTDFDYLIQTYAPDVDVPFSFQFSDKITSEPQSISADGTLIFGTNDTKSWILRTESERVTLPEYVANVKAVNSKLREVTVSWDKTAIVPDGLTQKSYNIYCDDLLLAKVDAASTPAEATRVEYIQQEVRPGVHNYSVSGEYTSESGKTYESPRTPAIAVPVAETFALPFFDDFESRDLMGKGWTNELLAGNIADDLKWQLRSPGDGQNDSSSATTIIMTDKPYSAALTSRYMDATQLDYVYLSFFKRMQYANSDDWDLRVDSLSIELSTDDTNWVTVKDYPADEVVAGFWNFEQIDISKLAAGKQFKLRLRTHGQALAQLIWFLDIVKVGSEMEKPAPEGLTGIAENGKVNLIWKNSINAYELSYLENSNALYELTIGDEGNPFIVANAFDAAQLKSYDGKYLTSVTTFLFDSPYLETTLPTRASILIYVDNKLVHEQEITAIKQGETFTVKLDKAIKVDAAKELKVAMKIFDYDPEQMPIYYQCTDQFVPGKSDLYSQDNGKTWQKLSDLYSTIPGQEDWGYCCWPMRANITDEEVIDDAPTLDTNLMGYNVYRNGVQINDGIVFAAHMKYIDKQPLDEACYEVVAYYLNGDVSDFSEQYCIKNTPDGIGENRETTTVSIYPNPAAEYIHIQGAFDRAKLLNATGTVVLETTESTLHVSSQPGGFYFLRVESGDKTETHKVLIK